MANRALGRYDCSDHGRPAARSAPAQSIRRRDPRRVAGAGSRCRIEAGRYDRPGGSDSRTRVLGPDGSATLTERATMSSASAWQRQRQRERQRPRPRQGRRDRLARATGSRRRTSRPSRASSAASCSTTTSCTTSSRSSTVEDFYRDAHQIIYRAIRDLYDLGKAIDAITLADELTRRDQFEADRRRRDAGARSSTASRTRPTPSTTPRSSARSRSAAS